MKNKFEFIKMQYIININGGQNNKLLNAIYIKKLENNLSFIGLELYGQMYFRLEMEDIKQCYENNVNILAFWGFSHAIPINGKLIIKYNDDIYDENNLNIKFIGDDFDIWNKVNKNQKNMDFDFYDKRIESKNYLRCKNGMYEICYGV